MERNRLTSLPKTKHHRINETRSSNRLRNILENPSVTCRSVGMTEHGDSSRVVFRVGRVELVVVESEGEGTDSFGSTEGDEMTAGGLEEKYAGERGERCCQRQEFE